MLVLSLGLESPVLDEVLSVLSGVVLEILSPWRGLLVRLGGLAVLVVWRDLLVSVLGGLGGRAVLVVPYPFPSSLTPGVSWLVWLSPHMCGLVVAVFGLLRR